MIIIANTLGAVIKECVLIRGCYSSPCSVLIKEMSSFQDVLIDGFHVVTIWLCWLQNLT